VSNNTTYTKAILLLLFLSISTEVMAQRGLTANAGLSFSSIGYDESDFRKENGFGFDVDLGYNLSSVFGIILGFGSYTLEDDENAKLTYFDIGPRFYPIQSKVIKPYLDLAYTGSQITTQIDEVDILQSGAGLSFGGGFNYALNRRLQINLGVTQTRMNYDTNEINGQKLEEVEFKSWNSRIKVGLGFSF
jgi:opacity protein-like surface antigen